jgi:hypothetical protein
MRARWLSLVLALAASATACTGGGKPAASAPPAAATSSTQLSTSTVVCPLGRGRCPNLALTPGEVSPLATTPAAVCAATAPGRDPRRQLTAVQEQTARQRYNVPAGVRVVEYDHFEAHWAGGRSTLANVWPQLNSTDKVRKDALENRLYRAVCSDPPTVSLETARAVMREFWAFM